MRVLGEGVAIEACIEDVSCASPRAGRHSMLETPWSLVICVRRVCPRVCAFPCHVTLTAHRSHLPDNFITLPKTRPRTSRCHGVKFRGLPATEPFRRRRRSMLVRLSLGRSSLIAGAAQSVGTCDLVPKKRVVSLRTGCCSSPKSSGFRGRRMRSGISGSQTPSSGRRVTRVVREAA